MLPIETLKLMRRKILKQLAAKNMRYRASWSDKVWDRKYDNKGFLKRILFVYDDLIKRHSLYTKIQETKKCSFNELFIWLMREINYDFVNNKPEWRHIVIGRYAASKTIPIEAVYISSIFEIKPINESD